MGSDDTIFAMDYYSLGYCISHSQCQWVLSLTGRSTVLTFEKIILLANGAIESNGVGKIVQLGDDMLVNLAKNNFHVLFAEWNSLLHLHELSVIMIPKAWPDLSHLFSFSVEGHVADQDCTDLVSYLASTNCLKKFSLKFNRYISSEVVPTSQKLLELLEAVYHHHTLEEKSVVEAACRLTTDDDFKAMSQIFSSYFDSMRTDFIKYVGELSDDGTTILAEILQHKYRSGVLDLNVSKNGLMSLAKALYHNSTIYVLKLFGSISESGAVSLSQTLRHNSTLRELQLYGNSIGESGAVSLSQTLRHNSTLSELHLVRNGIGDKGTVALTESLHQNSTLKILYLSGNIIGDSGAAALAVALHHNSSLIKIGLADNNIGSNGAVSLSQALHRNSTLLELDLFDNCIGDEGAIALAQSLHQNNTLQILHLSSNRIGGDTLYLQHLDLRNIVGIGERVASEFVQALAQNSSIKQITLSTVLRKYFVKCPNYNEVEEKLYFVH